MLTRYSSIARSRSFIIICCLILIFGIFAYIYLTDTTTNTTVLEKSQIEENIETYQGKDLKYTYVSSYLKYYGIGNINTAKINTIENRIERYFYKEVAAEYDTAKTICELYLEYFYDTTDNNDKEAVTDAVLTCFIASIGDRYAYYRTAEEYKAYVSSITGQDSFVGIGVIINTKTLEIIMVYKDSGAENAGIRRHDFVYAVDGVTLDEATPNELANKLKGEEGTTVNVTIKRGEELIDLEVTRKKFTEQTVSYELDEDGVGYIYVTQFITTTVDEFKEAVDYLTDNNAKGIVIDMRSNPGGLVDVAVEMVDYLVPDADGRRILYYSYGKSKEEYFTKDDHSVDLPIAIICNNGTASAAEIFTSAMRDFCDMGLVDVITVGSNTYGKGILQSTFKLTDGSSVTFTIGFYYPPSDVNFHEVGIAPDIQVDEIENGDAPFDKAKEELLK